MTMILTEKPLKSSESRSAGIFRAEGRSADKERTKLAAELRAKFQEARNDRWKQERQWYLNLAFYFGQQHVVFKNSQATGSTQTNFELYVPPAPYYRVRPVINHTRRFIRKELARLTAQKPNAYVIPASTEDRDIFAAQAAEQIWDSLWRRNKFNAVIRRACFWQSVCGNGYIKQYWNPNIEDPDNPDVMGDIVLEQETPFHIFVPDLKQEELEHQAYLFHIKMHQREQVMRAFNIDPPVAGEYSDVFDESLLNILGINKFRQNDQVPVMEAWVKPGALKMLPQGGMLTMVGSRIVEGFEEWPYSHGQYPFSKLDNIATGKFYTESILTDLIPLQREYNRTRGQIIEAKNRMAKPQLVAEEGSVDPKMITTEPGQVITYKIGATPPQPLPMQSLPSYVAEEVQRLSTDMADIAGQHEVSEGTVPPGVTAATAISFLQEQDESMQSPAFDSLEEAIEKTARHTLSYVKDYWTEERTVKIVGIDGSFDVQAFRGSELSNNTDIRVEAGTSLPTSRSAKQAFIMDLMKMNFIPPQKGLEFLEIGGINKIYEQLQVDIRQAQRENLKMRSVNENIIREHLLLWEEKDPEEKTDPKTGAPLEPPIVVPTNTYDNHPVHIEYHNRYRKSQAFEMADSVVKNLFEEHVKQHEELQMRQMPPVAQEQNLGEQPGPEPMPEGVEAVV